MDPARRWRAIGVGALALAVGGAFAGRSALGLEWSLDSLRDLVDRLGFWGPAVFVLLLSFRSVLLIPSQILLVAAGVCFGIVAGTVYGALGVTVSAGLAFAFARWLGREVLLAQVPPGVRGFLDGAGVRGAAALVFFGTAYPVGPVSAYHAGAALTGMPAWTFLLAVVPGAVVRAGVYTAFGSRLGDGDLRAVMLLAGALLLLAVPLAVPSVRRFVVARIAGRPVDGTDFPPVP
jgi:uncharacterized membrane protein YdjX (TVP38/TMEM64 family)